jgi:hypothetical protein
LRIAAWTRARGERVGYVDALLEEMAMRVKYIAILCLAFAASASAPAAANSAVEKSDGDRVICKTQAKTGTRFAKKICKTSAQWEAMREEARRSFAEDLQPRGINTCRDSPTNCH